ncbi:MAG TPA: pantoate--beta-alanine ligase [Ilumatobacteraceae bacterium]
MEIFETPAAMQAWSDARRASRQRVALVPTMGALHAAHLALISAAAGRGDVVVVSIFVNPLQFNRHDDFSSYPRPVDSDLAQCRAAGVDAVYAPTVDAMYPAGFQTHVVPGPLAEPMEGAGRPGHFLGVATVVTKLFNAVRPDVAVFGQKDYQQLAVISRMVADLDMGIEIVAMATVREADGLAMSSRNKRLDPLQREASRVVFAALRAVEDAAHGGEARAEALRDIGATLVGGEPMARLEYLEIVDPVTLQPVDELDLAGGASVLATIAAWFGEVRLIDNVLITAAPAAASGSPSGSPSGSAAGAPHH